MKIEILEPTIAQRRQVMPGDVLDVPKDEALVIVSTGRARLLPEAAETATLPTQTVETADAMPPSPPAAKTKTKKNGDEA